MQETLRQLLEGRSLSESEAQRAFHLILTGAANESQVGALLALLAMKGPVIEEIMGGARELRAHVTRLPIPEKSPLRATLIDTCGTGGAPKTFNISTAAAIVAAAARGKTGLRAYVAKHGGRSRTGRGSAEVLASLGVNIDAGPETQVRCLERCGVCFSFAVNHHPAMKFAAGPRKSLGFPTVFNLLGPLCNPAGAERQVMGVYDARYVPLIAEALRRLGARRAIVAHGLDGMDELTTTSETIVAHVESGRVRSERFDALSLGIDRASLAGLSSSTLEESARMVAGVLSGERGPPRDIVLVNAAAALVVSGVAESFEPAMGLAEEAIDSARARSTLEELARVSSMS